MNNDIFLFAGILVFFFVLWLYSGGPTNPISFAGPYITPVTDVGVQSVGYGDDTSFWSWTGFSNSANSPDILDDARSPLYGKVYIAGGTPQARDEDEEYVIIRSSAGVDVTLTGWQLVGAAVGTQVRIPEGGHGRSSGSRTVELSSGENLLVVTGSRIDRNLHDRYSESWFAYLERDDDIWRNSDDTLTLLDASGKVVDQYRY